MISPQMLETTYYLPPTLAFERTEFAWLRGPAPYSVRLLGL